MEHKDGIWPKALWGVALNKANLQACVPSLAVRTADRELGTSGLLQICSLVKMSMSPCGFLSIARISSSQISFMMKEPNFFMKRLIVKSNIPLRSVSILIQNKYKVVMITYFRMFWL
jgi:hypothetical protein